MRKSIPEIEPVAIAIERVLVGPTLEISGIDLDTGMQISVVVQRPPRGPFNLQQPISYDGKGLILTLTVETLSPN